MPIEQHLHSLLDMAPLVAFGWLTARSWQVVAGDPGWQLAWRAPALPGVAWAAVLGPALLLCVAPALLEFKAARAARR